MVVVDSSNLSLLSLARPERHVQLCFQSMLSNIGHCNLNEKHSRYVVQLQCLMH